MSIALKRLALGAVCAGMLTIYGCGGGGGGGAPAPLSMVVTPSLGQFSAGTPVKLKRPDGGELASGAVGVDGKATLPFSNYTGPVVVEVGGGVGVKYYDEGTGLDEDYSGTLRAVLPAPQTQVGVTALTHAAAAKLVVNDTLTADAIKLANTKVAVVFGYADGTAILQSPTLVSKTSAAGPRNLNVATVADRYALILAALAKSAAPGNNKTHVVAALAADLKDDKLDGKEGASAIAAYDPVTIIAKYKEAADDLADDTSRLVVAGKPLVVKTDVSAVVNAGNQSDIDLAKAMFAELRTTLNAFSNGETGFLDTQATRMSNDLNANVAPALGKVASRIGALGETVEAFEDAKAYSSATPLGFVPGPAPGTVSPQVLVRTSGFLNAAWYGSGRWSACHTDAGTAGAVTKLVCSFAGTDDVDKAGSRIRLLTVELTRTGIGRYSYVATRKNLAVSLDNVGNVVAGNTTVVAVPDGTGTATRTLSGGIITELAINGTMPPSTDNTGADTIAVTATRTELTASNFRYAATGSVSTTNLADSAKNVTLALNSGSYFDLNEVTGELDAARFVGVARTVATQFLGSLEMGSFVTDASGQQRDPTRMLFNGSISDTSSGGAGQILTGQLEATVSDYNLFNAVAPETSSNFLKIGVSFVGTVQAPARPQLKLVLGASTTGLHGRAVTLDYSYGPGISITGSGTVDELNPANDSMTLSNQAGIQFVTKTGHVTRSGSATLVARIVKGVIHYEDGVSESLL